MSLNKNALFWNIYAKVYDKLNNLDTYKLLNAEIAKEMQRIAEGEKVLNIGCGTSSLEYLFSKNSKINFKWLSVDISKEMLSISNQKLNDDKRFSFLEQSAEGLGKKLNREKYDYIIASHSLYNLIDLSRFMASIKPLFKKNTRMIIVNPLRNAGVLDIIREELKTNVIGKIPLVPIFIIMIFLNLLIIVLAKKNRYTFLSKEEYIKIFSDSGYSVIDNRSVYAGQSILFVITL